MKQRETSLLKITTERPADGSKGWIGKLWEVRNGQWTIVWQCRGRKQASVFANVWHEYQDRLGLNRYLKILEKTNE